MFTPRSTLSPNLPPQHRDVPTYPSLLLFRKACPEPRFLSEHFSRIVIVSSSLYYLINVCFLLGCKSMRARACLLSITMVSPVHSLVSGTQ